MFFWNRKKEVKEDVQENVKTLAESLEIQGDLLEQKYRTNYYNSPSAKKRESLRSKKLRKDEIGEYKLEVELSHLPTCFIRLSNLLLNVEGEIIQIDHLIISPYGLFFVENCNLAGLIVGEEADHKWFQAVKWRVKTFPNPLIENERRIQALREQIGLKDSVPVFSYVAFNCRCNLKVFLESVFYDIDLVASIVKLVERSPIVLEEEEILLILGRIEQVNLREAGIRNEYYARQRRERMQQRPKYGDIRCHICRKPVTERVARHCLNRPDKFAWRIYCEKHQKEMTRMVRQQRLQQEQEVIEQS